MKASWTVSLLILATGALAILVDIPLAQRLARYAHAVYCDENVAMKWNCVECIKMAENAEPLWFYQDPRTRATVMIVRSDKFEELAVVYRGTVMTDLGIWANNLKLLPRPAFKVVKNDPEADADRLFIHHGFAEMALAVRNQVVEKVNELVQMYPNYTVQLTGHSLGGAMATFSALDIQSNVKPVKMNVVTFGSPRVGNEKFVQFWNKKLGRNSMRVVNRFDIVPHLPFSLQGYKHVAHEIWVNGKSARVCENDLAEHPKCSARVLPILWNVEDHGKYFGITSMGDCNARK